MRPLVDGELVLGSNGDGVAGPEMDEGPFQPAVLDEQFIAPAGGVCPCLRAVKHDGTLLLVRRLQPQGNTERIVPVEVAQRQVHRIVASELDGVARVAGHEFVFAFESGGLVCVEAVGERICLHRIEAVAGEFAWHRERHGFGRVEGLLGRDVQLLFELLNLRRQGRHLAFGLLVHERQRGRGRGVGEERIETGLVDVLEQGEEPVVVLLLDRIELVIVAARAFKGKAEKGRGERLHAVAHVLHAVLFLHAAALAFLLVQAVEGGGQDLVVAGVREQVAGELPGDELVVRQVVVKRLDHPVAPGPDFAFAVHLEAVAVGIAGHVQPVHRHAFAEVFGREQAVHQLRVCGRRLVGDEGRHFLRRGRQAGEVKSDPADERGRIGFGLQLEAAFGETGAHERVDVLLLHHAAFVLERNEGPVRFVFRALADPLLENRDLRRGEIAQLGLGGRHVVVVGGENALDHLAGIGLAGDDGFLADGALAFIKAQLGFTLLGIRPVTEETLVREDGPDVAIELELAGGACGRCEGNRNHGSHQWQASVRLGMGHHVKRVESGHGTKRRTCVPYRVKYVSFCG